MQYPKRFLLPILLMVFSILAFGCQSESTQEPKQTDPTAEDKPVEKEPSISQPVDIDETTNISWVWSELIENEPTIPGEEPVPGLTVLFRAWM